MAQAVHGDDRPDLDSGRRHREDEEGNAVLLLRLVACAHEAENPVRVVRERGPDLLTVDDIVPAVARRAGLQRGEVGARARLGIALAPDAPAGEDLRQVLGLLLFGAERHQHRPDHAKAEAGKARRARQPRLLVENVALHGGPARAAMLLRPGRRNPAAFVERAVPAHVVVLGNVHARDHLVPHVRRQLVANEGPHLLAEGFLGCRELHRRSPYCHRCRSLARRSRRCHGLRLVRIVDPDGSTAVRKKPLPRNVIECRNCPGSRPGRRKRAAGLRPRHGAAKSRSMADILWGVMEMGWTPPDPDVVGSGG